MAIAKRLTEAMPWGPFSRLGLGVALATLLLDQASKAWVLLGLGLPERGRITVAPFMDFVFVKNTGISYGMLSMDDWRGQALLTAFAAVVAVALAVWLARGVTTRLVAVSLGLIIGGAVGNAIDRLLIGGVADFVSLHAFGFYWYVFNIADVAIVAGVAGLLYDSFWVSRNDATSST